MATSQQNLDLIVLHEMRRLRATARFTNELFLELDKDATPLRRMILDSQAQATQESVTATRVTAVLILLLDEVKQLRSRTFARTVDRWDQFLEELAQLERNFYARLLGLPPGTSQPFLSERTLLGQPLRNWQEGLRLKDAERIVDSVRQSIGLGVTASQTAKAVVRKTNLTKSQLQTLVEGSAATVSVEAAAEAAAEAGVTHELYTAKLDKKTSPICRSLDGNIYPVGEGPQPLMHHRCRSRRVPLVGSEKPQRESYEEWLGRQSPEVQEEILGQAKALLFRRGELKLARFVSSDGRELTLAELAERDAEAFRKAGLDPKDF